MNESAENRCSWCGSAVELTDGYRVVEHAGDRGAAFCRLEHVVPWAMQGAHWEAGEPTEPVGTDTLSICSVCDKELGELHLLLVRHWGEHRIADGFCSMDHLVQWSKKGGRWSP